MVLLLGFWTIKNQKENHMRLSEKGRVGSISVDPGKSKADTTVTKSSSSSKKGIKKGSNLLMFCARLCDI